ncbi:hypothetical protein BKA63DRAFT_415142, partial [Paraphoma chrysanthemicola]
WAVYLVTLEKPGARPRVYVGSSISCHLLGAATRIKMYKANLFDTRNTNTRFSALPTLVKVARASRWKITHVGLLCAGLMHDLRNSTQPYALVIRALESVLLLALGLMHLSVQTTSSIQHCPWSIETLEYDGLCRTIALAEN